MAITIVGPTAASIRISGTALVERKRLWTGPWELDPSLEFLRCTAMTIGAGVGECELLRRYGTVKQPYQTDYNVPPAALTSAVDFLGHWVRVRGYTPTGVKLLWMGRIESEVREPQGPVNVGGTLYAAGQQNFIAYEAAHLLDKIDVARSVWLRPKLGNEAQDPAVLTGYVEQTLEWVPGMNARDPRNFVSGNARRQVDVVNGDQVRYGGTEVWSGFGAAQYLLDHFANGDDEGPEWRLGGQAALLNDVARSLRFQASESLLAIVKRIISAEYGLDAVIVAVGDSGFELYVFALSAREQSYGGFTFPTNPRTVEIRRATSKDAPIVRISRSAEHAVGRVEILGARLVGCTTLENIPGAAGQQNLSAKWSAALEADYASGTGVDDDSAEEHDAARKAERLRPVYRNFGAPPLWDRWKALSAPALILQDGKLQLVQASGEGAPFQNDVRETLTFLPFKTGLDYSADPPLDPTGGDPRDPYLSPQAWLPDEERIADQESPPAEVFIAVDQAGMNVSALLDEWGLSVGANPPHLLGKNHFEDPPPPGVSNESGTDPLYDWSEMKMTIAFRTDQRVKLVFERVGGARPQDGTVTMIEDDAEFWFAVPGTVFGVDRNGILQRTPQGAYMVLRDDSPRLFMQMAGLVARYFYPRSRADVQIAGLFPYSMLLGQILTSIEEGGDSRSIHAPITSVSYHGGKAPRTEIKAGYAR